LAVEVARAPAQASAVDDNCRKGSPAAVGEPFLLAAGVLDLVDGIPDTGAILSPAET
jgi:hypothetical protein